MVLFYYKLVKNKFYKLIIPTVLDKKWAKKQSELI
jgi:hypothetical protein